MRDAKLTSRTICVTIKCKRVSDLANIKVSILEIHSLVFITSTNSKKFNHATVSHTGCLIYTSCSAKTERPREACGTAPQYFPAWAPAHHTIKCFLTKATQGFGKSQCNVQGHFQHRTSNLTAPTAIPPGTSFLAILKG